MKQIFSMDVEKNIDAGVKFASLLRNYGITGEFYICGELVEKYPHKVKMIAQGHIIGGHGYYHEDFAKINFKEQKLLIDKTISIFKSNEIDIKGWRFPGVSFTNSALNYVSKRGLFDSSLREKPYLRWKWLIFIRNWLSLLQRRIVSLPLPFFKLDERPWSVADLNDNKFYTKNGRIMMHCYKYNEYEKELKEWLKNGQTQIKDQKPI